MEQITWDADLSDYYDPNMSKAGIEKVLVLDGQQRLQILYATFFGAIESPDNQRAEAYFDTTSGTASDEQGLMYRLCFSTQSLSLPWYRVADIIGKDSQQNPEELADRVNEELDAMHGDQPGEQFESPQESKARGERGRQLRRPLKQRCTSVGQPVEG